MKILNTNAFLVSIDSPQLRRNAVLGLLLAILFTGCGKQSYRPLEEIREEQASLPTVYLTEKTKQEVVVPINRPVFVHESTGELCYPALICQNPDCPGGTGEGSPGPLFIHSHPLMSAGADGTIQWATIPPGKIPADYIESLGGHSQPTCPACLKQRKLGSETDEQKKNYQQWVVNYMPPESAKRAEELKKEYDESYKHSIKR
jgi:hypothetical protein